MVRPKHTFTPLCSSVACCGEFGKSEYLQAQLEANDYKKSQRWRKCHSGLFPKEDDQELHDLRRPRKPWREARKRRRPYGRCTKVRREQHKSRIKGGVSCHMTILLNAMLTRMGNTSSSSHRRCRHLSQQSTRGLVLRRRGQSNGGAAFKKGGAVPD